VGTADPPDAAATAETKPTAANEPTAGRAGHPPAPCPVCSGQQRSPLCAANGYHIFKCFDCGSASIEPLPARDELKRYYNTVYDPRGYWRKAGKKMFRARKRIFGLRLFVPTGRFLDVGCSAGYMVAAAQEQGFDGLGIDLDEKSVAFARNRFPKGRFCVAELADLINRQDPFGLVHCSEVIEHVPDIQTFVQHLWAVCAPGGFVYVTTPNAGHRDVPSDLTGWEALKPPEHIHYLTRSSLKGLFRGAGFRAYFEFFSPKPGLKIVFKRP